MMKPEIKAKWINALRSGEYPQITGSLCKVNIDGRHCYCALGVLCHLHHMETYETEGWGWRDSRYDNRVFYHGEDAGLPEVVVKWAGLSRFDPDVVFDDGEKMSVVDMNDDARWSFDRIANCIEDDPNL